MTEGRRAIFLHSGFRSGSTWFWSRFRAAAGTRAYYEPLHESLADIRPETLPMAAEGGGLLRHPALDAPYFEEYRSLVQSNGGIPFYDPRFALKTYFETGPNPGLVRYLDHLTASAGDAIPVLGFCRSLARVPWMRRQCDALHIVTVRKPWNRWISYRQQATEKGNPYFLFSAYVIAVVGRGDSRYGAFFQDLPLTSAQAGAPASLTLRAHFDTLTDDQRLRIFLRVFVLEMMIALQEPDHVVDLDRMSVDAAYRAATTETLRAATGLPDLSFEGCDLPDYSASADARFRDYLDEARTRLLAFAAAGAMASTAG